MSIASAVHVRPITKEWAEKGDIPERALDRELCSYMVPRREAESCSQNSAKCFPDLRGELRPPVGHT